jgi:hypothetical protein
MIIRPLTYFVAENHIYTYTLSERKNLFLEVGNMGMNRWNGWDLIHKLTELPQEAYHWLKGKKDTLIQEKALLPDAHRIRLEQEAVGTLLRRLEWKLGLQKEQGAQTGSSLSSLTPSEIELIERLQQAVKSHNRNNITRTAAYLQMFHELPELHWSFLAHMVSRNGGWCMTDLKGELLPYLLNEEQREFIFQFLERANALIFHDAYPQLLLYQESRRIGRSLFHLLPAFEVSAFMRPVWENFWEYRDSALLTVCLIINEQHYIEKRVVQHPVYQEHVLDTLFFTAQSVLQLNQVVFPYRTEGEEQLRMAGLILENFSSLHERIEVGKNLYAILFGIPAISAGARQFASMKRHTGSRTDYWPHLFASVRKLPPVPRGQLQERLNGGQLRPGAQPLYSPPLGSAWKDRLMASPEPGDWFTDLSATGFVTDMEAPQSFEMTHEYGLGLNKIELAVLAGDLIP